MNKYLFEKDYGTDYLRWIRKLEEKHDINLTSLEELEKFQNEIIQANDSAFACFFAATYPYKQYRMQKIILDKKDAKYAFLFAQNIKNSDTKALQNVVVNSKKIKYICKFACFVKSADRKPLEQIILKSKDVKSASMFLRYIKGSDVKKFKDVIISSGKPRYLFELAKHVTNPKEISMIEDLIIQSGSFTYMRLFAERIKLSNIEKIEQAVLDSDNVNEIKKFAKYVKRSKMKKFFLVL